MSLIDGMTEERLEKMLAKARREGYADGFRDGCAEEPRAPKHEQPYPEPTVYEGVSTGMAHLTVLRQPKPESKP